MSTVESIILAAIIILVVLGCMIIVENCKGDVMPEESPGRITITDKETNMDTGQAVQPVIENIYTKQIGQFINAVDEIAEHVMTIGHKVSIMLEEQPPIKEGQPPVDSPRTSTTVLSGNLAELASHITTLGNGVLDLENRIIT